VRLLWLLGQFALIVAFCAVLIAAVIAIWYALSLVVLTIVGHLFPLRGWRRKDRQ
jgi:hypothetical protein